MSPKLKFALIYRCSDKGFALPMAIGLGLIMLLIAATMIMRSQDDRTIASMQKATSRGLSAAETGISRYQSLINNNRVIAKYNACIQRDATTGNCSDTGTVISWANASAIPGIAACTGANGSSAVIAATTGGWQDVDSSDSSKGQYKLRDYTYTPDTGVTPNTPPGTGTLIVDGRVNQNGNGNIASEGVGTATTRLQVNIRVAKQRLSGVIPGLWLQNIAQNMGSNKVDGNILVSGCPPLPTGVSQSNLKDQTTQSVTSNPNATIPDTPPYPTSNLNTITSANMDTRIWGQTLPRVGDINSNGTAYATGGTLTANSPTYSYLIDGDLARNGSANITLRSNANIVFYVRGNINMGGGPSINVSGKASNMQIYGNTFLRNSNGTVQVDASNRPQTKYGCSGTMPVITPTSSLDPPSYTGACPTTSVAVNGNASVHALIHAPDATGAVSGGGGDCNSATNTGFIGALWFKKWNASSNASNALVCAEGDYGSFLATQDNAPPSISSITAWQRQEVQP